MGLSYEKLDDILIFFGVPTRDLLLRGDSFALGEFLTGEGRSCRILFFASAIFIGESNDMNVAVEFLERKASLNSEDGLLGVDVILERLVVALRIIRAGVSGTEELLVDPLKEDVLLNTLGLEALLSPRLWADAGAPQNGRTKAGDKAWSQGLARNKAQVSLRKLHCASVPRAAAAG